MKEYLRLVFVAMAVSFLIACSTTSPTNNNATGCDIAALVRFQNWLNSTVARYRDNKQALDNQDPIFHFESLWSDRYGRLEKESQMVVDAVGTPDWEPVIKVRLQGIEGSISDMRQTLVSLESRQAEAGAFDVCYPISRSEISARPGLEVPRHPPSASLQNVIAEIRHGVDQLSGEIPEAIEKLKKAAESHRATKKAEKEEAGALRIRWGSVVESCKAGEERACLSLNLEALDGVAPDDQEIGKLFADIAVHLNDRCANKDSSLCIKVARWLYRIANEGNSAVRSGMLNGAPAWVWRPGRSFLETARRLFSDQCDLGKRSACVNLQNMNERNE